MWLMTKHGFYSIVRRKTGEFHIRARVRKDLENLVERVPFAGAQILSTKTADYPFRIIVGKDEVLFVLNFLGETLNYSNFKGKIARTPDQEQKHDLYAEVWSLFSDAFGAYGRCGKITPFREG
jgi:hypothetical protein